MDQGIGGEIEVTADSARADSGDHAALLHLVMCQTSDDDTKNEKLGLAMMLRVLENGAAAIQYIAARDPAFLERSFENCAVVFAMWPDATSASGVGLLPIKRNARDGIEQGQDVIPCSSREMAGALLEKFGDTKLKAEFADYLRPLN